MSRPRLLDLFCGAGGAAMGYHRAGWDVLGVDIAPQPRYPFAFVQGDALEYVAAHGREYDAIHASPPCQAYSVATNCRGSSTHQRSIPLVLAALQEIGGLWVVENVPGSSTELKPSLMLCGLMFGLKLFRHRYFASSVLLLSPPHLPHQGQRVGAGGVVTMAGHGGRRSGQALVPPDHRSAASWRKASGIDWMTRDELAQAIPPAYTEFIGRQLINALEVSRYAYGL